MNKFRKAMLVTGCAVQVATATTVAVRYAYVKKAVTGGKAEQWIREVMGQDINVVFDDSITGMARLAEDKSTVYFRLGEKDIFELAVAYTVSPKAVIQSLAAHEMGHYVDPRLQEINGMIQAAVNNLDYDAYGKAMIEREVRAWQFGKKYAPNKRLYKSLNINSLRKYKQRIDNDEIEFELAKSSQQLYNATRWFS